MHYAPNYAVQHSVGIGAGANQDIDDDDRDDDTHAYDDYQADPHYDGYGGSAGDDAMHKLDLNRQQSAEDADGDHQSNESTQAVADYAGASRQNSTDDLDFAGGCESCGPQREEGKFQCDKCGEYLGGS